MDLPTITERPEEENRKSPAPLLAHGFRPFFLLAGGCGALFLSAWLGMFTWADSNPTSFSPVFWHGHEMVFGFILTATSTWSRHPPVRGPWLLAIIAAWAASRPLIDGLAAPGRHSGVNGPAENIGPFCRGEGGAWHQGAAPIKWPEFFPERSE